MNRVLLQVSTLTPLLFLFLIVVTNPLSAQSFPYEIELEPAFTIPGLDGIHSFAAGKSGGKWLLISGRRDGMHRGGGGQNNPPFPSSQDNTTIYVVDPVAMQSWSTSLSSLSVDLQNQLSSTNTSFYQDGDNLYIIGGYGADNNGNYQTYDAITAINVPSLINNIINGNSITGDFIQLIDNRMKIAGGQLGFIDGYFYLVGGMELTGIYTQMVNPIYSEEMRTFQIINNGTSLSIANYSATFDSEFHRRDYNLIGQVFPDTKFGYMVSSGVFTPSDGVFYNPIEIKASGYTVIPTSTFKQEFSHYQSAKLSMYDSAANEMHSIFFGGIAQYYLDANGNKIDDPDVPFVKTISRVTRDGNGAYSESVFSTQMPVYLGAGSELFLDESLPMAAHEIIDQNQLTGDTVFVGYIFGGLESGAGDIFPMNTANSSASNKIYKVNLIQTALPLDLLSFKATPSSTMDCKNASIKLQWKTANEFNVKEFYIERAKYGNFEKIDVIPVVGNSVQIQNYQYTDSKPIGGKVYYRLKIIDIDGSYKYSNIIVVQGCKPQSLEIVPNPTTGDVFITGQIDNINIKIFDQTGKQYQVNTQSVNDGLILNMRAFPAGIYFIYNGKDETYRIIKQ